MLRDGWLDERIGRGTTRVTRAQAFASMVESTGGELDLLLAVCDAAVSILEREIENLNERKADRS